MDSLTLDQVRIFVTIVDEGSFSKAAKTLNRAQSAVTYGIQKLEAQFGLPLFDRTAYRPQLTEAGRTLLVQARRIDEEANAFRETAHSLASGLEAELTIVIDSMFPMPSVVDALRAFTAMFPTVPPRVYVQPLGGAADLVLDRTCMIGLLPMIFSDVAPLRRFPLMTIELVPVAAPDHPLATIDGPIGTMMLNRHVQLVLTDRSTRSTDRDHGVLSGRTWRLADLGAKQSMLLAGLGWGNMSAHLVEEDVARGRLKILQLAEFDTDGARVMMSCAHLGQRMLGPAGRWMIEYLSNGADSQSSATAPT